MGEVGKLNPGTSTPVKQSVLVGAVKLDNELAQAPTKVEDKKDEVEIQPTLGGTTIVDRNFNIIFAEDLKQIVFAKGQLEKLQRAGKPLTTIEENFLNIKTVTGLVLSDLAHEALSRLNVFTDWVAQVPVENRKAVKPNGVYLPKTPNIPNEANADEKTRLEKRFKKLETGLKNGTIDLDKLSDEDKGLIAVTITKNDVLPIGNSPERGRLPDVQFKPDGKPYPINYLPPHTLSRLGAPYVVRAHNPEGLSTFLNSTQENIDPKSLQIVYYKFGKDVPKEQQYDTNRETIKPGTVMKGFYFEVTETKGEKGNGGANGVIVPINIGVMMVNHHSRNKNENGKTGPQLFYVAPE